MTKVSIVIPTYNRDTILDRAIDSALNQTLQDLEVIVVDDASTDETESIVNTYSDSRLKYTKHKKNQGGSAARNTGIECSNGEYIAFLDSDDSWKQRKLRSQVTTLERRSSEWIAAYCDFTQSRSNTVVEKIDNLVRRPTGLEGGEELIDHVLLRRFAHGGASTLLVRREAAEAISGFDPTFERYQDVEFLIRLLQTGKLAYVDEKFVLKNDTGNPSAQTVVEASEHLNEKFADLISDRGYMTDVKQIQQFMIAKQQLEAGNLAAGFRSIFSAKCPHYRDAFGAGLATARGIRKSIAKNKR